MKISKAKLLGPLLRTWRKLGAEEAAIPRDVPKGHLAVYVGERSRRFVIRVAFLEHPLFRELLERAREEYDFPAPDSRLCIPCDETLFLNVVRCVSNQQRTGKLRFGGRLFLFP